jgi:uncharacterized glyoxalase superfamily protein PhnB
LVVQNAHELVNFLHYVFAAAGKYDAAAPSVIEIGDSKVMISEVGDRDIATAFLYVYVSDVTATYRRALERGATSIEQPFDTRYGDRRCMIKDQCGNTWQIAAHFERRRVG